MKLVDASLSLTNPPDLFNLSSPLSCLRTKIPPSAPFPNTRSTELATLSQSQTPFSSSRSHETAPRNSCSLSCLTLPSARSRAWTPGSEGRNWREAGDIGLTRPLKLDTSFLASLGKSLAAPSLRNQIVRCIFFALFSVFSSLALHTTIA
ncbi:hypothetical protein L207DRAFT_69879 [Hyaloscypha variabilis F]|uniref:Uncharacterized protein n=1 Tax=Hyaloscypha variabilis (strain UAMH 11265 / GT02V1 / F) TaxID=1149755 RepID=A0A2J6RIZ1_HYAVF|nr:hypothetical protein L207DRAFT_69879 [Hyaloscypha variabilis F]